MNGSQARAIMKLSQINCLKLRGGGTGNINYNFALKFIVKTSSGHVFYDPDLYESKLGKTDQKR